MSAAGHQQVRYPVQAATVSPDDGSSAAAAGAALAARFPSVPAGMVWTVGIMLAFPAVGSGTGTQLADFQSLQWQVVRNGIPEFSWVGNAIVKDLQLIASDTIEVWGFSTDVNAPYPQQTPEANINVLMQGDGISINQYVPVSPSLYVVPSASVNDDLPFTTSFGTTNTANGSASMDLNPFGFATAFVRLTHLSIYAGVIAASTGPVKAQITIADSVRGMVYASFGLCAATNGYANVSKEIDFNRMPLATVNISEPAVPLTITWAGIAGAVGWRLDVVGRIAAY